MVLLFITLIRAVPMSQLNTAAHCRSLAVGDVVPQEPKLGLTVTRGEEVME